jgi:hypothetical protein
MKIFCLCDTVLACFQHAPQIFSVSSRDVIIRGFKVVLSIFNEYGIRFLFSLGARIEKEPLYKDSVNIDYDATQ